MAGDIQTTSGTKFYISTAAAASTVDTLAEYEALTWTEVGEIEDLGNVGDVSTEVTGAAIGDGRIRKAKGARNAGTMNVICFDTVPLDAGQLAVIDAEATNDNYAFKIELPDAPPPPGTADDPVFPRAGDVEGAAARHQRQHHAAGFQHRRQRRA